MALLEVDHVSRRFGGLRAVNDVAFSIEENTITFIVGPNGAGKTTPFNLITGVLHPDEGRIRFDGVDITRITPNRAAHRGIGRTFQIVKPLAGLTVLENVMLGLSCTHPALESCQRGARSPEVSANGKGHGLHGQRAAAGDAQAPGNRSSARHQAETDPARRSRRRTVDRRGAEAGRAAAEAARARHFRGRWRRARDASGHEHRRSAIVLDHGAQIAEGRPQEVVRMPVVIEAYRTTQGAGAVSNVLRRRLPHASASSGHGRCAGELRRFQSSVQYHAYVNAGEVVSAAGGERGRQDHDAACHIRSRSPDHWHDALRRPRHLQAATA